MGTGTSINVRDWVGGATNTMPKQGIGAIKLWPDPSDLRLELEWGTENDGPNQHLIRVLCAEAAIVTGNMKDCFLAPGSASSLLVYSLSTGGEEVLMPMNRLTFELTGIPASVSGRISALLLWMSIT